MPKKKGDSKTGGRKSGIPNRTSKEAKELLETILFGQLDNINDALDNIRTNESESKYIDSVSKLFTYVLPKKTETDLTTGGEQIVINIVKGVKH